MEQAIHAAQTVKLEIYDTSPDELKEIAKALPSGRITRKVGPSFRSSSASFTTRFTRPAPAMLAGNHDVNIVDRANPARLDLPFSPGKRLRQIRTLDGQLDLPPPQRVEIAGEKNA